MGADQSCCSKRSDPKGMQTRQISKEPRPPGNVVLNLDSKGSSDGARSVAEKVGIGAYFQRASADTGGLSVKSLLPGSPAQKCGKIKVGDIVLKVDGDNVFGKKLAELAEVLLGPTGSKVTLEFRDGNTQKDYSVVLERGIPGLN
eukprot:CAMPEP_0179447362 /NCGR_PEP_ID=MMETSP0799-20121207/31224_1 /TAXON_ID=46947 /ORGANISM="Geminigera cryophila, Strain CCMP2564" /LENGTH=144 /DNA_ID=CAMNT_0021238161 /DNA_START=66 /DNA_END=500 /DNA_ORIENTATION=+